MSEPQKVKLTAHPEAFKVVMVLCASLGILGICAVVYSVLVQLSIFFFSALLVRGYSVSLEMDAAITVGALVFLFGMRNFLMRDVQFPQPKLHLNPVPHVRPGFLNALGFQFRRTSQAGFTHRSPGAFTPLKIEDAK
jgi:hypothetical protein